MVRYYITQQEDGLIVLSAVSDDTGADPRTLQLTPSEFAIFMQYPTLTQEEICAKIWEESDKTLGKRAIKKTVALAFDIMGRG